MYEVMPEALIPAALLSLYLYGVLRDRRRAKRGDRWPPSAFRPLKRFKSRARGWGIHRRRGEHWRGKFKKGQVHDNWVRLWPNPGYLLGGVHWCRKKHPRRVRWR